MRKFHLKALMFLCVLFSPVILFAQNEWKEVNEGATGKDLFTGGRYKPAAYKIFQLNEPSMQQGLQKAPSRDRVPAESSSFILTIPGADGQPLRFRAVESTVMDPALAAKYPEIKTYFGQGIDDPASTIYFDYSPRGFHAMVLSASRKTMYIDPVDREGKYYVVFSRQDVVDYQRDFKCLTPESARNTSLYIPSPAIITGRGADDGRLRTYRLALACTGEYATYFLNGTETTDGQRKAKVLAAMVTLLARTNAIYERDFGIHMNLVANNDQIIYLNAATDPWVNELNVQTQRTIDQVIGNDNYDIGHLVDRGNNNGNAGCIGCVCRPWNQQTDLNQFEGKGGAFTSHTIPEGDPFVVDYTTHEMGHQFGANHTFAHAFENTNVQMEPGSGSTIMGYAGITAGSDVQASSDDYFHAISIQQVVDYIKSPSGAACAAVSLTNNTAPTANAGSDYTIPHSTPFMLTGTGSDVDASDVVTFTWEQFNSINATTGRQVSINPAATEGPLFRSRPYSTSPSRTFPILSSILNNANFNTWERLPAVSRVLDFRFTVRDNNPRGGNTKDDDMRVTVVGGAGNGPFAVTSPNTAVNWGMLTQQQITWSVANTNIPPINCQNVKISLSYDGGLSYPVVLAQSTPNNGSYTATIPGTPSPTSRIKIEAIGNIFFDVSNVNFRIVGPEFEFVQPAPVTVTCQQTTASVNIPVNSILGFNVPVTLSASNVPAGTNITFSQNPVTPGQTVTVTLNQTNLLPAGSSNVITIRGVAGTIDRTTTATFNVESQTPPVITTHPQSLSSCIGGNATLSVTATNAVSYQWQLSTDGGTIYTPAPGVNTGTTYTISNTQLNMINYRYRVRVTGTCAQVVTSNAATLNVIAPVQFQQNGSSAGTATVCETVSAIFQVSGISTVPIIYQWQVSTNGGATFSNITDGEAYAGTKTSALTVRRTSIAQSGHLFRALMSNATCTTPTISPLYTLIVNARPTIQLTASPFTELLPGQTTTVNATITPPSPGFNITWTRNDQVLPGITGTSYLVDSVEVGDYKVRIVNPTTLCNNESNVLTIGATASANLFIYPTPNNGTFTVSYYNGSGGTNRQTLAIYDTRGQQVYSTQLNVNGPYTLHTINLTGKARGIYYVVIGDGSGKKFTESKVMIY